VTIASIDSENIARTWFCWAAGNASMISDGAAAVVVASSQFQQAHGLTALARIRASVTAGLAPTDLFVAPILAIRKAVELDPNRWATVANKTVWPRFEVGTESVLEVAQPLAYCLPGVRGRVVVSEGTLDSLAEAEVAAILSHERAHLRARHDLVLEAFTAAHAAFPRFVRSASALDAVQLLAELLADDAAVRVAGRAPLARALVTCASGRRPLGALAAGGTHTLLRVRRLSGSGNSLWVSTAAYLAAAAVLIVPTAALAVPWLTELHRLFTAA